MNKKLVLSFIIATVLLVASLLGCFLFAKKFVAEKDHRLALESYNNIDKAFNGKERIVCVEYSGQNVNGVRVGKPTKENTVRKREVPQFFEQPDGSIQQKPSWVPRILNSKEEYDWQQAYGDITAMYELTPRYDGDDEYTGFLFRIYENKRDAIVIYTLYPRFVGYIKHPHDYYDENKPSIQSIINDCFEFYTENEKSSYYGDILFENANIFNEYRLCDKIENEYYEMWSYKVHSNLVGGTERGSSIGEGNVLNISHNSSYRTPEDDSDLNKLGFFTWYNNYYARVFMEAYTIDVLSFRYRFLNYRGDPINYDFWRIIKLSVIPIVVVYLLFVFLFFIMKKKTKTITN